ncbi:MAG: helix-turn-helix domain-containing protein [Muribaculaceae bacterium]|nr:helix-turn-helix domain-containing protein [Muribaculaceae bacterium]
MTTDPPKVNPDGRYPIGVAAKLLGIDRGTLLDHAKLSIREGGIRFSTPRGSTRKFFSGRDITAYWQRRTGC